ncbi:MAG: hypothetical protein EUB_03481 [Eubacterium sp.]|uniref:hypothetical protein n=1 Tax=Eubacterium sp. TaxID=142586 RepID=UPI003062B774
MEESRIDEFGEEKEGSRLEFAGKQYSLRFNIRRLQQIEQTTKTSTAATLTLNMGMLGIQELIIYFAFGLADQDGEYIKPSKGMNYAEEMIQKDGYAAVNMMVVEALQKDCGFLFQSA